MTIFLSYIHLHSSLIINRYILVTRCHRVVVRGQIAVVRCHSSFVMLKRHSGHIWPHCGHPAPRFLSSFATFWSYLDTSWVIDGHILINRRRIRVWRFCRRMLGAWRYGTRSAKCRGGTVTSMGEGRGGWERRPLLCRTLRWTRWER